MDTVGLGQPFLLRRKRWQILKPIIMISKFGAKTAKEKDV